MEWVTDDNDESSGPPDPPAEPSSVTMGAARPLMRTGKRPKVLVASTSSLGLVNVNVFCRASQIMMGWVSWLGGLVGWVG